MFLKAQVSGATYIYIYFLNIRINKTIVTGVGNIISLKCFREVKVIFKGFNCYGVILLSYLGFRS